MFIVRYVRFTHTVTISKQRIQLKKPLQLPPTATQKEDVKEEVTAVKIMFTVRFVFIFSQI